MTTKRKTAAEKLIELDDDGFSFVRKGAVDNKAIINTTMVVTQCKCCKFLTHRCLKGLYGSVNNAKDSIARKSTWAEYVEARKTADAKAEEEEAANIEGKKTEKFNPYCYFCTGLYVNRSDNEASGLVLNMTREQALDFKGDLSEFMKKYFFTKEKVKAAIDAKRSTFDIVEDLAGEVAAVKLSGKKAKAKKALDNLEDVCKAKHVKFVGDKPYGGRYAWHRFECNRPECIKLNPEKRTFMNTLNGIISGKSKTNAHCDNGGGLVFMQTLSFIPLNSDKVSRNLYDFIAKLFKDRDGTCTEIILGSNLEFSKIYPHSICNVCKAEWLPSLSNLTKNLGSWCPCCASERRDKIETGVRMTLEDVLKMKFDQKSGFKNSANRNLFFDGYNAERKIAFEYHGEQHDKLCAFLQNGEPEKLKRQKANDAEKVAWCKENGVKLIVVRGGKNLDVPKLRKLVVDNEIVKPLIKIPLTPEWFNKVLNVHINTTNYMPDLIEFLEKNYPHLVVMDRQKRLYNKNVPFWVTCISSPKTEHAPYNFETSLLRMEFEVNGRKEVKKIKSQCCICDPAHAEDKNYNAIVKAVFLVKTKGTLTLDDENIVIPDKKFEFAYTCRYRGNDKHPNAVKCKSSMDSMHIKVTDPMVSPYFRWCCKSSFHKGPKTEEAKAEEKEREEEDEENGSDAE